MPLSPAMDSNPGPVDPAALAPGPSAVANANPANMEPSPPLEPVPSVPAAPTAAANPNPNPDPNPVVVPDVNPVVNPGAAVVSMDTVTNALPPQQPNSGPMNVDASMASNSMTTMSLADVIRTATEASVAMVATEAPASANMAATTQAAVPAQVSVV